MSDNPGADKRPGAGARKRTAPLPDAGVGAGYTDGERKLGRYVRSCYVHNISAFHSAQYGEKMRWEVPSKYDGKPRKNKSTNDPQDANKKQKNVWYEVARWMLMHQLDGPAFVHFIFSRLTTYQRIPEPLQLCNEAHIPKFRQYIENDAVDIIAKAFEAEARTAQSAFKSYRDMFGAIDPEGAVGKKWAITENVILDSTLALSPLFRYLLALSSAKEAGDEGQEESKLRFLGHASALFDRAVFQFMIHKKAYSEHWKRWLPKTFAEAAEARFRKLAFNEETEDEDKVV